MEEEIKEISELKHAPEPGYGKIFNIVLSVTATYLFIIFVIGSALG